MKYKSVHLNGDCKRLDLEDDGFVWYEGYASVFDVEDAYGDIVRQGAFKTSLEKRSPIILYQHDSQQPVGKISVAREDSYGLWVRFGILHSLPMGDVSVKLLDNKIINGLSIGYNIVRAVEMPNGGRELQELDLYEISLVAFPANELSRVRVGDIEDGVNHAEDLSEWLSALKSFNNFSKNKEFSHD